MTNYVCIPIMYVLSSLSIFFEKQKIGENGRKCE